MPTLFEVMAVYDKRVVGSHRVQMMVMNTMKVVARQIILQLNLTTEYWKHKVEFGYRMKYAGGDIRLFVGPIGSQRGAVIWRNINNGTAEIPVIFNKKYKPKTEYPGAIGTNTPGEYTLPHQKIVGRKLFPGPPGIRPRSWTNVITRDNAGWFTTAVQRAIQKGLQPK